MFLFCDLNLDELIQLVRASDDVDAELASDDVISPVDQGTSRSSHDGNERAKNNGTLVRMMRSYVDLDDDSPYERDIRFEDLRNVNEWDARRSGFAFLCQENLYALQHNSQGPLIA